MSKISEWTKLSLERDLASLESDPAFQLSSNDMRQYLGRDYYAYEKAVAQRETIDPRDLIDNFTTDLADQTEALLKEVRLALNAARIVLGSETQKQLNTRQEFIIRAQDLANQWESEIGGDGLAETGREQYAYLFTSVTYDDPTDAYYDVNRALESTPIYRLVKAEDYQPNRFSTVNGIQTRYLHSLLHEDAPEFTEEQPGFLQARLQEFKKRIL
ncbi:hypothetical protein ACXHXG_12095 [Rhizobium sp. LEGMi198b]